MLYDYFFGVYSVFLMNDIQLVLESVIKVEEETLQFPESCSSVAVKEEYEETLQLPEHYRNIAIKEEKETLPYADDHTLFKQEVDSEKYAGSSYISPDICHVTVKDEKVEPGEGDREPETIKGREETEVAEPQKRDTCAVEETITEYVCSVCEKKCISRRSLNQHMRFHSVSPFFQCPACGKTFNRKSYLSGHLKTKCNVEHHKCSLCKETFLRISDLEYHRKTHFEDTPLKCSLCNGKFSQKLGFIHHLKIHTENELIECFVCKKKYVSVISLTEHIKMHNIDKLTEEGKSAFKCFKCGKNFTCRRSVNRHMGYCCAIPAYQCSICTKKFSRKCDMYVHMGVHKGK